MRYLQSLVQIPTLDPDPPSFLLLGQLVEQELARQIKVMLTREDSVSSIATLVEPAEVVERTPSRQPVPEPTPIPRPSPVRQKKVVTQPKPTPMPTSVFDAQFASVSSAQPFDFTPAPAPAPKRDERWADIL